MKIYAIKDRLINYWMQPFVGPSDKAVMAAVANQINGARAQGDFTNALAQAPHHFELWKIGNVEEDGHLTAERDFIADCSALVRGDIRSGRPGGDSQAQEPATRSAGAPAATSGAGGAQDGSLPYKAPQQAPAAATTHPTPQGGD